MKKNTNKKILSIMFILLFFITIITAVNTSDDTNTTKNTISDYNSISTIKSDANIAINDNNIKKSNIKNNTISTKEKTKQNKKESTVNSFDELYEKIEDIKTNSNDQSETINLNPGNYYITKTINWEGSKTTKTLTINGNQITLDGQKQYQFITVAEGYTLNLANITINNCQSEEGSVINNNGTVKIENSNFNSNNGNNGGVNYNTGNLTIENSNFNSNNAGSGGVNYNQNGNITIENSNFNNNNATDGGVNHNGGNITIENSNFTQNKATANGGINYNYVYGNITINNSNFTQNNATNGGVNSNNNNGNLTIENSNFTQNKATEYGGVNSNGAILTINNSNFTDNKATYGGVNNNSWWGTLTINNSNFTDNNITSPDSNGLGGVIYNEDETWIIENSTLLNTIGQNNTIYSNNNITLKNVVLNNIIDTPKAYIQNTYCSPILIDSLSENENITITVDNQTFNTNKNIPTNTVSFNYSFTTSGNKTIKYTYLTSYPDSNINLLINNVEAVDIIEIRPISDIKVFDKITVDVTLKKADGTIFTDELPVAFKIADKIYDNITVTGGQTTQQIDTTTLPVGNYQLVVITGVEKQTQFNIIKRDIEDKRIILPDTKVFENTAVDVTINDEVGEQLVGTIPVEVVINGNSLLSTNIIDGKLQGEIPTDTLTVGTYDVEFKIPESDNYNAKTFTTKVNIIKRDIKDTTITLPDTKVFGNTAVDVTINDEVEKQLVGTVPVEVVINGNTVLSTNIIDGKLQGEIPTDTLTVGTYDVEFKIPESDNYNAKTFTTKVNIIKRDIKDTTITLPDTKVFGNTAVDVTINDEVEKQLVGTVPVEVVINGNTVLSTNIIDGKLQGEIPTDTLTLGIYDVEFKIPESDNYNAKIFTTTLKIVKRNVTVEFTTNTPKTTESLDISVTIKDTDGVSIVDNGKVTLKIDEEIISEADVKDSKANLNYTLPADIMAGKHIVEIEFSDVNYNLVNKIRIFNVEKSSIADDILIPVAEIKAREDVKINTTIVDMTGKQIEGSIPVEVIIDGKSQLNTIITNGVLNTIIPTTDLLPGDHNITFKIKENGLYNAKEITNTLTINKRNTTLTIKTNTTKVLNTLTINITLNDENMTINGGNVVFKINNKVICDIDGNPIKVQLKDNKAQLNYTLPQEIGQGHYNITAVYESNTYNKVENSTPCDIEGLYIDVKDLNMSIKAKTQTVLNITLYDENGEQLIGTIKGVIKLNDKTLTNTTINNGVLYAILDTQTQKVGNHKITVKLGEGKLYNAQEFNINLTINKWCKCKYFNKYTYNIRWPYCWCKCNR